ncbi:hypothetical protein ACMD2_10824 [Ananas comosus]|uniref:Uncharacterized protein n=1 Tax=Ananas comosus TaxID=4615 RepID=A0A199VRI3_ANACO|nr:hypothetical protein ACMD2_10824 [Ananas comosus]
MSTLVLTCTRHVSRASRKLGLVLTGRKPPSVPSLLRLRPRRRRKKQLTTPPAAEERNRIIGAMAEDYEDEDEDEDGVWRRTILLGERCQPLDFSGAIHYDSRGRRLPDPAPRRTGSPPSSFAYRSAVFSAETAAVEKVADTAAGH